MVAERLTGEGAERGTPPPRRGRGTSEGNGPDVPPDAIPEVTVRVLRHLLERRGLTQHQLAQELGITDATLSRWLGRKQGMPMATLVWVADRMSVPLDALFREPSGDRSTSENLSVLTARFDSLLKSLRLVTLYRWGARGDPRSASEDELGPVGYQQVPAGQELALGGRAFALLVERDTVAGRGVYPGDVALINPDQPYDFEGLVAATVGGKPGGTEGQLELREVGADPNGRQVLRSAPEGGPPEVVPGGAFHIIGPVVVVLAVSQLPRGRGHARERPVGAQRGESRIDYMNGQNPTNESGAAAEKP